MGTAPTQSTYKHSSRPPREYTEEDLAEIAKRRRLNEEQRQHDDSIRRQQMKIKKAPWRTDPSRPDFVGF